MASHYSYNFGVSACKIYSTKQWIMAVHEELDMGHSPSAIFEVHLCLSNGVYYVQPLYLLSELSDLIIHHRLSTASVGR